MTATLTITDNPKKGTKNDIAIELCNCESVWFAEYEMKMISMI